MTHAIEFYFDFVSPYSYLACTQLPGLARQHAAEIVYKPFRLLELMKLVGNRPTTIECKNKRATGSTLALGRQVRRRTPQPTPTSTPICCA
jgi:2-hydroxychromene-2-carboxylate isomerase